MSRVTWIIFRGLWRFRLLKASFPCTHFCLFLTKNSISRKRCLTVHSWLGSPRWFCCSSDQTHRKEFIWKKEQTRSTLLSQTLYRQEITEQKLDIRSSEQGLLLFCLLPYLQKRKYCMVSDAPLEEIYYMQEGQMIQVPKQFINQDVGLNISEPNLENNISYSEKMKNNMCYWEAEIFRKKSIYNCVFSALVSATGFVYDLEKNK